MSETIWLDEDHNYALHIFCQNNQLYGRVIQVPNQPFDDSRSVTITISNGRTLFTVGPEDSREKIIEMARKELKQHSG